MVLDIPSGPEEGVFFRLQIKVDISDELVDASQNEWTLAFGKVG